MIKHGDVWAALDKIARDHGLSSSGLAKHSGLDPTTFNPSKRITESGRERWPTMESISKVLNSFGLQMRDFILYFEGDLRSIKPQAVPILGFAEAGRSGIFDDSGYPVGSGWDFIPIMSFDDPHAFALEISGNSMIPVYRDGDVIIVSPSSSVRRHDRVVVKTIEGEVMAKVLFRETPTRIELESFNKDVENIVFRAQSIEWISRIIWASQ